jgi:2-polyprenyl-3-methyl-5-hydroxy-6-metoxy-1,4-benzoquinol methylase
VIDVGCGTGSLAFTIPQLAGIACLRGVDVSAGYIDYVRAKNTDSRLAFEQAVARRDGHRRQFRQIYALLFVRWRKRCGYRAAAIRVQIYNL